jgi:uncharacterized protein YxjI
MNRSQCLTISKKTVNLFYLFLTGLLLLLAAGCSVVTQNRPVPGMETRMPQVKRYYINQKVWTIGERFLIRDELGNPLFHVKGKVFSFGDKLRFLDMAGNELAYIKQKLFSFKKRYHIYRNRQLLAKVVKKITLFKDRFIIDIPGPDDYLVKGNFGDHRYTIIRGGREVAFISKKWLSWGDTYRIEIFPGEDDVLILAATVIIDMVSHGDEEHHHH